jgi:RNA polymerase sigma factor (sigma-70 family)
MIRVVARRVSGGIGLSMKREISLRSRAELRHAGPKAKFGLNRFPMPRIDHAHRRQCAHKRATALPRLQRSSGILKKFFRLPIGSPASLPLPSLSGVPPAAVSPPPSEHVPVASPDESRWFTEELQPHESALRGFLQRRYPALSDVDDVIQVSFLKTFRAWRAGKLTSVKGFLFTVAVNATLSLFRRRKFISTAPVNETATLRVLEDDADVIETVCSRDEMVAVAEAVARLPDRCRRIVTLRLLQGVDYPAIAQRLGISEETVRVQVARGMKKVSQFLQDNGILDETAP